MIVDIDIPELDVCEFPFYGKFVRYSVDYSLPLDEQEESENLIIETRCDIQANTGQQQSNLLTADYFVAFPLKKNPAATSNKDKFLDCGVRRGDTFIGECYGDGVIGVVSKISPSQIGRVSVDIKVVNENGN